MLRRVRVPGVHDTHGRSREQLEDAWARCDHVGEWEITGKPYKSFNGKLYQNKRCTRCGKIKAQLVKGENDGR